jgi:glycosyltransferase involved in cell wall biosynthesis
MVDIMEIDYINGQKNDKIFGMSKYQLEIVKRLDVKLNVIEFNSLMTFFDKKYGHNSNNSNSDSTDNNYISQNKNRSQKLLIDLGKNILKNLDRYRYIQEVKNSVKDNNIKHITTQEMAYIQNSLEMDKTIITCHDLIPWVYDKNRSKFWKDNINGLKKADIIITISEFSKNEIIKYVNYPPNKIHIINDAVDHSTYFVKRDKHILRNINITDDHKVVLYVGSETKRQNIPVLLKAFAHLKKKIPDIKLVKIGDPQSYGVRETILRLINDLELRDDIVFAGYVPEKDMPRWYNASDILVYPCDYAGFGLPPLEAMACGTPVITSNTSSLPEVVGDAGIMIDPRDVELMADKMYEVLTNNGLKNDIIEKGIKQAKHFTWDRSAEETYQVYELFNDH